MKDKFRLFFCSLFSLLLSGCSISINIDTMLTPPKLSGEQEQIYQALQEAAGSDIRLKYPKSGSYLSAFIIADIDSDSGEEAIVFYEKNSLSSGGLRINILDKIDDRWQSICDRSAEGSEIEKVIISQLGSSDRTNILVGYSTANQSEKYLSVYAYENNYLEQPLIHSYALFDVADTGSSPHPDLILLGAVTSSEPAYAAVYRLAEDNLYHEYKLQFSNNYTDYQQLIYGKLPDGRTALYVDAATGTSSLQTEIFCLAPAADADSPIESESDSDLQIVNLLQRCGKSAEDTVRRASLSSMDIDHDGCPEIPVQQVFLGYESSPESEQIRQTNWLTMQENQLFTEYQSYYNINDGYIFLLPELWKQKVTVINNMTENEIQFCTYDSALSETMPVLLRIYIAYDDADRNDHLHAGYQLLHTKGTASCLVKAESGQELSVPTADILLYFHFLD
ncbi:MAG: hypothetical protein IJ642_01160 [Oscillospiraceae bacterium]|nr:hypothetical protein [Oscillospiraceae bacterium]